MPQPFRVFRGAVYAVGFKPDGDTLAFRPQDPAAVAALPDSAGKLGTAAFDPEKNGAISVRLQGIDAPETHYQPVVAEPRPAGAPTPSAPKPSAGNHHQKLALSRLAAQTMLGGLGITVGAADWHSWGYLRRVTVNGAVVTERFQEGVEAVVVANTVDLNGRLLGWVFPASASLAEGATLSESALASRVKDSLNAELLETGMAYPYYYYTLSTALRGRLAAFANAALKAGRGVWAEDTSAVGTPLRTLGELNDQAVIWPYLFRKLLRSWRHVALETWWAGGDTSEAALERLPLDQLYATGNPYVYVISKRAFQRLDEIVEITGDTLRLRVPPKDVVFLE